MCPKYPFLTRLHSFGIHYLATIIVDVLKSAPAQINGLSLSQIWISWWHNNSINTPLALQR
jgi:hypothetical protein